MDEYKNLKADIDSLKINKNLYQQKDLIFKNNF